MSVEAAALAVTPRDDKIGSKDRLRLWIRLLRTSRIIEGELREKLKSEFGSTLPRFDVMSALNRQPDGMLMSDLSRYLLVADGFVQRARRDGDRRTSVVALTDEGRAAFARMAVAHAAWVDDLLHSVSAEEARMLASMLKGFRSDWEETH